MKNIRFFLGGDRGEGGGGGVRLNVIFFCTERGTRRYKKLSVETLIKIM